LPAPFRAFPSRVAEPSTSEEDMRTVRRFSASLTCWGITSLAALAAPTTSRAQADIEVIPYFATYFSIADAVKIEGFDFKGEQLTAPAVGARLRVRVTPTLAVEGSFGYTTSDVSFPYFDETAGAFVENAFYNFESNIILGSGRLVLQPARSNLRIFAGAGVVRRGGSAWEGLDGLTSIAGTLGLGVRAAVTPRIALDITVEGWLYSFDLQPTDGSEDIYASAFQQDVLVTVGIPIGLLGR
jgi:hypothetical protein